MAGLAWYGRLEGGSFLEHLHLALLRRPFIIRQGRRSTWQAGNEPFGQAEVRLHRVSAQVGMSKQALQLGG